MPKVPVILAAQGIKVCVPEHHSDPHKPVDWEQYQGQVNVKNHRRDGVGTYTYSDGYFKYEGEWQDNVKHGKGKLYFGDEGVYEGKFVNGQMTGSGKRVWTKTDTSYKGQFDMGDMHGKGTKECPAHTYSGDFVRNKYHGEGMMYSKQFTYKGQFANHKWNGKGNWENSDGVTYKGDFVDNEFHGQGRYHDHDANTGFVYEGEFANNQRNGNGTCTHDKSQLTFTGQWQNGVPHIQACCLNIELGEGMEFAPVDEKKKPPPKKGAPVEEPEDDSPKPLEEPQDEGREQIQLAIGQALPAPFIDVKCMARRAIPKVEEAQLEEDVQEGNEVPAEDDEEKPVETDPFVFVDESGRRIQFTLYQRFAREGKKRDKIVKYPFPPAYLPPVPKDEEEEQEAEEKKPKEESPQDQKEPEPMPNFVVTKEGQATLSAENLAFDDTYKPGCYVLLVEDVTTIVEAREAMPLPPTVEGEEEQPVEQLPAIVDNTKVPLVGKLESIKINLHILPKPEE